MKGLIANVNTLIENGSIPSCYISFRKLLESLCWAIFDDCLTCNSDYYRFFKKHREVKYLPAPYENLNRKWYQEVKKEPGKYEEFKDRKLKPLRDKINKHLDGMGFEAEKGNTTITLVKNMSYPLFLWLASKSESETEVSLEKQTGIYFKKEHLEEMLNENLKSILKKIKRTDLCKKDKAFIEKLAEDTTYTNSEKIVAPYPKNSFVVGYIHHFFPDVAGRYERRLTEIYGEYSQFVHSYNLFWQIYPFSSVLEFKVLKSEINEFLKIIEDLIRKYLNFVRENWKY